MEQNELLEQNENDPVEWSIWHRPILQILSESAEELHQTTPGNFVLHRQHVSV